MANASDPTLDRLFPLVFCINLKEREDRFREARCELTRAGFRQVTFYRSQKTANPTEAICDAHAACWNFAIKAGVSEFLVFEDDVLFQQPIAENLRRSAAFFQQRAECPVLYLGGFIFRKKERLSEHFVRGASMCTHGYLMRASFAGELLAKRPLLNLTIDVYISVMAGNRGIIHVNPLACIQRASASDNNWDTRSLNSEGWLGQAMLYTALSKEEKKKFTRFSRAERFRIENGIWFFNGFRLFNRWRMKRSARRGYRPAQDPPNGEFQVMDVSSGMDVTDVAGAEANPVFSRKASN
jgi:hypothetical protein